MSENKSMIEDRRMSEPCQKASGASLKGDSTDQTWESLSVKINGVMDNYRI